MTAIIYFVSGVLAGLTVGWLVEWLLDWRSWRIEPPFRQSGSDGESVSAASTKSRHDDGNHPTPSHREDE